SYSALLRKRIFVPLHIVQVGPRAIGYAADGAKGRAHQWDLQWASGAGAIVLNAADMLRWDAALLDVGPFSTEERSRLFAPSLLTTSVGGHYAAGFIVDSVAGRPLYWHNGEVGGFHTANFLFPADDLAIVVLSNDQRTEAEAIAMQTYGAFAGLDPNVLTFTDGGWAVARRQLLVLVAVVAIAIALAVVLYRWLRRRRQARVAQLSR
ncbi:MAG TPA: serine hydrolase domain-containing protein, partial [Candidatus Aquilonibacter sp.]